MEQQTEPRDSRHERALWLETEDLRFLRSELLLRMTVQNGSIILNALCFFAATIVLLPMVEHQATLATGFILFDGILASIWCHHGARQAQIKAYLLSVEARYALGESWESWLPRHPIGGRLGSRWFISTKGAFIAPALGLFVVATFLDASSSAVPMTVAGGLGILMLVALLMSNPKEGLAAIPERSS